MNRSKGFGFVEMPNDDEANNAINGLNETEMDGRTIVVKEAQPAKTTAVVVVTTVVSNSFQGS